MSFKGRIVITRLKCLGCGHDNELMTSNTSEDMKFHIKKIGLGFWVDYKLLIVCLEHKYTSEIGI